MVTVTPETLAAPVMAPEDRPSAPSSPAWWERVDLWVGLFVVAACCAFVFVQLDPRLLFRNTTPSGGDTAAHVWWPAYLRDHLLPWRLAGWTPDFYAGFPAGQFYFPVPALLVVALDVVLPYNVAFKLVTAFGPVAMPIGAYVFGRGLRAPRPAPAAFAVAATAFLFFTGDPGSSSDAKAIAFNQHIAGGTIASTLAGEYSYTIAIAFALAFLGTLAYSLRTGRHLWIPAVLLAATVMSHLVVAIFAGLGALVIWLAHRPLRNIRRGAVVAGVGGLLTAVWLLPLLGTLGYTTDMRYAPIACPAKGTCPAASNPARYLFPDYLFGVRGGWPWQWGAVVLIVVAVIGAAARRRRFTATLVLFMLTALSGVTFRVWEDIRASPAWNLRFLPFWYVGVFLLMGLGVAEAVRGGAWLVRRIAEREEWRTPAALLRAVTIGGLTVALALGTLAAVDGNTSFLPYWIRWNYRGYEDTTGQGSTPPKQYREYRAVIDTMQRLPPGRALWEGNNQLNVYGSPLALMLLPYWTHGRIASMEGVYYEASATTPYHFMTAAALDAAGNASNAVTGVPYRDQSQFALGVRWLQALGVRYLMVHSVPAKAAAGADHRLRLVATVPDFDQAPPNGWSVYRVADSPLVQPLTYQPVVVDRFSDRDRAACERRLERLGLSPDGLRVHEWQDCIAVPWFNDPTALDRPLVDEGPASWQHSGTVVARALPKEALPSVRVTDVHSDDHSVSFRVSRTGEPVVVKTSFFPNWEASGARGPYRATPDFMVVVPTRHHVTLTYATTTTEWLGRFGTLLGVAGVIVLAGLPVWRRRRRRRTAAKAGEPASAA